MLEGELTAVAASTSPSIAGVALVVAAFAVAVVVVLEVQLRIRRTVSPPNVPPTRQQNPSTPARIARINYLAAHGRWIRYYRVVAVVVVVGSLSVALLAALIG